MNAATALVVLADVSHFGAPITIDHDGEFVQVTIAPNLGTARTYCKRVSYNGNEDRCAHIADEVEKVAAIVGWPSLTAWLLDCGFVLTH